MTFSEAWIKLPVLFSRTFKHLTNSLKSSPQSQRCFFLLGGVVEEAGGAWCLIGFCGDNSGGGGGGMLMVMDTQLTSPPAPRLNTQSFHVMLFKQGSHDHRSSPLRPPTIEPSSRPVLEVAVVPVPVLVVPVGKLGVPLAVGDASKRRVVVEAGVEDFVHDLLRLLPADVPHSEDGAERAAPDARLVGEGLGLQTENNDNNPQTRLKAAAGT